MSQSNEIRTLKDRLMNAEKKLQVIIHGVFLHIICIIFGMFAMLR